MAKDVVFTIRQPKTSKPQPLGIIANSGSDDNGAGVKTTNLDNNRLLKLSQNRKMLRSLCISTHEEGTLMLFNNTSRNFIMSKYAFC